MKAIIKLIFLGVVIAVGNQYLQGEGISVKEVINKVTVEVDHLMNEMDNYVKTEKGTADESGNSHTSIQSYTSIDSDGDAQKENAGYEKETGTVRESNKYDNKREHITHKTTYSSEALIESPAAANKTIPANVSSKDGLEWIKEVTRKYSANSWELLQQYESLPSNISISNGKGGGISSQKTVTTYHYLDFDTKEAMLSSMSTNVHEIAHGHCSLYAYKYAKKNGLNMNWENVQVFMYISPTDYYYISVPKNQLFPSKELINVIPSNLRTYRYKTYITGNTSTQSEGVVGLLDEFHAYYLGSKFNFDMLEVYKAYGYSEAEGVKDWIKNTQSEMSAFYEFKFFILEYLRYMKKQYPADYKSLMQNENFVGAYISIHKAYRKLTENYFADINKEIHKAKSSGKYKLSLENNTFWIQKANSYKSSGTKIISKDVELLQPILSSNKYDAVLSDMGLK